MCVRHFFFKKSYVYDIDRATGARVRFCVQTNHIVFVDPETYEEVFVCISVRGRFLYEHHLSSVSSFFVPYQVSSSLQNLYDNFVI